MSRVKAASSPASPPLTSGSVGVIVEKRRHRSDRYRLIPVSAICTREERLHKIRDRPEGYSPLLAAMRDLDRLDACRHCISKQDPIALAYPHMLIQGKQRQALASFVSGNHIFFIKENIPRRFLRIWVNGRRLQHSIVLNLHDGQHIAFSAAHADISFADFDGARSERF